MYILILRTLQNQPVMMRHVSPMRKESLKPQMRMAQLITIAEVWKITMYLLQAITGESSESMGMEQLE